MTDKITTEQAIQHLKNVYACGSAEPSKCLDAKCDKCEYHTDPNIEEEVFRMAIEALKLHTPTKPNWQGDEKCMDAYCPNCGEYLDDGETPCDECTQLIDWSDSNE